MELPEHSNFKFSNMVLGLFVLVEASKHSCSSCVLVAIEYKLVVEPHPPYQPLPRFC